MLQTLSYLPASDEVEPVFIAIGGKAIWVGYRTIHMAMSPVSGRYVYYEYEPRNIPVFVLIDHYLHKILVSNTCYSSIVNSTGLTVLNDTKAVLNGIFISHGELPTISVCDFSVSRPDDTSQVLVLPSLREGTYYFMAAAQSSGGELWGVKYNSGLVSGYMNNSSINNDMMQVIQGNGDTDKDFYYILPRTENTNQSMRLLADIIDFEILDVSTAVGSNTGSTTTRITGALFDTVMDFRLVGNDGFIPASQVHYVNSTEAYVTFNLTDVPEGTYNVEAELPGGIITSKEGAFYVGQNLPSELSVNIVAPARVRVGQVTGINIDYSNSGASDLNVVGLLVRSSAGTFLSPIPGPDQWVNADVYIPIQQVGDPPTGPIAIPWSNQNQAPDIKDVTIPSSSSTTGGSTQTSTPSSTTIQGGLYPIVSGGGGRTEIYTKPDAAGRGTIDVYPVYRIVK